MLTLFCGITIIEMNEFSLESEGNFIRIWIITYRDTSVMSSRVVAVEVLVD